MWLEKVEQLIRIASRINKTGLTARFFWGKVVVAQQKAESHITIPSLSEADGPNHAIEGQVTIGHEVAEFKSPMVGTFTSLVSSGQSISVGDRIAVITSLRLNNVIQADICGEIKEVCVNDGDPIEWGQTLFLFKKN